MILSVLKLKQSGPRPCGELELGLLMMPDSFSHSGHCPSLPARVLKLIPFKHAEE